MLSLLWNQLSVWVQETNTLDAGITYMHSYATACNKPVLFCLLYLSALLFCLLITLPEPASGGVLFFLIIVSMLKQIKFRWFGRNCWCLSV